MSENSLTIEPFEARHVAELELRAPHLEMMSGIDLGTWAQLVAKGLAFTIREPNGEILACAGVTPLWRGVGEVWLVGSPMMPAYGFPLARLMVRTIRGLRTLGKFNRLQAVVRRDFGVGHRFIKTLGFKIEGLMERYGPEGADYVRYGLVEARGV